MKEKYVDLHIHSTNSDGLLTPQEIVNEAEQNNVDTISITDHDFMPQRNVYTSITINHKSIRLIPGAELSTDYYIGKRKIRIHILAYDAIDKDGVLHRELEKKKRARFEGNYAYVQMLIKKLKFLDPMDFEGFDYSKYGWLKKRIISYLDLTKYNEQDVKLLMRCLDEIKPIYPKCTFDIEEGIVLVKNAGGMTSFAHPYQTKLNPDELRILVQQMKSFGLDAIETFHAEASEAENSLANNLAEEYKLLKSCGSDFHNTNLGGNKIGYGINENMKIERTTLSDCLIDRKKYFFDGKYKGGEKENER